MSAVLNNRCLQWSLKGVVPKDFIFNEQNLYIFNMYNMLVWNSYTLYNGSLELIKISGNTETLVNNNAFCSENLKENGLQLFPQKDFF
jgi:hypothetical protein